MTYYHCTSACGTRFRADKANDAFLQDLLEYLPKKGFQEVFVQTISDAYHNQVGSILDEKKLYISQIHDQNKKIDRARDLLLNNEIDAVDFRTIKIETSEKINRLESRLGEINNKNTEILDIKSIAEQALINLKNLDIFFDNADVEGKRYLISCIFPEKIVYDGDRH